MSSVSEIDKARRNKVGRGTLTRQRLILAAEQEFALHGRSGATALNITKRAEARNINAVAYHFKNMEGLFEATMRYRMEPANVYREKLLDRLEQQGPLQVMDLAAAFLVPHIWTLRHIGQRSYCAQFFASLQSQDIHGFMRYAHRPWCSGILRVLAAATTMMDRHYSSDESIMRLDTAISQFVYGTAQREGRLRDQAVFNHKDLDEQWFVYCCAAIDYAAQGMVGSKNDSSADRLGFILEQAALVEEELGEPDWFDTALVSGLLS